MTIVPERLTAAIVDRYRIERELGQGGMATVYLAHDIRHDRHVALKVLKPELAAVLGGDRFVQEIRTTAALQHPHILPLFDSGVADSFLYYVMPFIDGETLRSKLDRETQLGIDEAVRITVAIADALDYAHRRGIIHRDIKPENILLHEGRPMVADFGIALAVSAAAGGRMTETGLSLGTPHYMSPEQATAEKEISARSDIYSLASVLYEMLTGNPPHVGASAQQIIMKIVTEEAAPVTKLRRSVPPHVAAAVAKALEKLPADRFASANEFGSALTNPAFASAKSPLEGTHAVAKKQRWQRAGLLAAGIVGALLATGMLALLEPPERTDVIRMTIEAPADSAVLSLRYHGDAGTMADPIVSPSGTLIAFTVAKASGPSIYMRSTASFELTEIPGDGKWPFFSPDGGSIGYLRGSEIWTMNLADAAPARAAALTESGWDIRWAVWHADGRILVLGANGLWAVPLHTGVPQLLLAADTAALESFHELSVLPDGRLLINATDRRGPHVKVVDADGRDARVLPDLQRLAVVDDIAFYIQDGQPRAALFDARKLRTRGDAVTIPGIWRRFGRSIAWVDGVGAADLELVWVTRSGTVTPVGIDAGGFRWPRVAPDGNRIVVGATFGNRGGLRVIDVRRQLQTPVAGVTEPVWSADGTSIIASSGNIPAGGLIRQIADGSRPPDTLYYRRGSDAWPTAVTRDGKWLTYYGSDAAAPGQNLSFMDLASREVRTLQLPGTQRGARFSPDGKWVAYESEETGVAEIHVRPWPALDASYAVTSGGGFEPIWSADGSELFYRQRDEVRAVSVSSTDGRFERSAPTVLFTGSFQRDPYGDQSYDLAPDGRFLMMRPLRTGDLRVQVALNWITEVRARLAERR